MSVFRLASVLFVLAWLVTVGCNPPAENKEGSKDTNATTSDASEAGTTTETKQVAIYCGKCGEVKGSEKCCKEGEKCDKCGLHKGSALCCKELPEGAAGKDICSGCGQVAEANHQCKAAQ